MADVRVLTPDDWELWQAARLAALTDAPHAFTVGLADWHRGGERRWRARLAMPGACNIVATRDGRPVGLARGVPAADGTAALRSVWVGPSARGHGLGDLLVTTVEDWAGRTGHTALRLTVLPDNAPALALYRRHGFVDAAVRAGAGPGPSGNAGNAERVLVKCPLRPADG